MPLFASDSPIKNSNTQRNCEWFGNHSGTAIGLHHGPG